MHLISLNLGHAQPVPNAKDGEITGIYKYPVLNPVWLAAEGLQNDTVCDAKHHGGPDQAVYVYGTADYAWWAAELGQHLAAGTFGENLTISDLVSAQFAVGDQLQVGAVTLEVTAPRIPCHKLAARMGDPAFAKRFRQAERPGLYCRVLQPGLVQMGDVVRVTPYTGDRLPLVEMFRDFYEPDLTEASLRRYLALPIAVRDREHKEKQLHKLLTAA